MRFAISVAQYARDSRFDDDAFRSHLRRVEELGLSESAWAQEQVISATSSLAPLPDAGLRRRRSARQRSDPRGHAPLPILIARERIANARELYIAAYTASVTDRAASLAIFPYWRRGLS